MCGDANHNELADRRRGAVTVQGRSNIAHKLLPSVNVRPEIDERCNGSAIRQQSLPVKVRKRLIRDVEAVRPYQPIVLPDAPAISYAPANHPLAVCGATEHKPFEG